jgi:hypothetical protein
MSGIIRTTSTTLSSWQPLFMKFREPFRKPNKCNAKVGPCAPPSQQVWCANTRSPPQTESMGLWQTASQVGIAPICVQTISSTHVHRLFIWRFLLASPKGDVHLFVDNTPLQVFEPPVRYRNGQKTSVARFQRAAPIHLDSCTRACLQATPQ